MTCPYSIIKLSCYSNVSYTGRLTHKTHLSCFSKALPSHQSHSTISLQPNNHLRHIQQFHYGYHRIHQIEQFHCDTYIHLLQFNTKYSKSLILAFNSWQHHCGEKYLLHHSIDIPEEKSDMKD